MSEDPDWPALLTDYEAALEVFERVTKALTVAMLRPGGPNGDERALLAAEAAARDAVVMTRMRLMNAWRDATPADVHWSALPDGVDKRS
jgi:hypothetical protein